MAKRNLGEKIKLSTYDEMFGTDTFGHDDQKTEGQIINIPLSELHTFKDHNIIDQSIDDKSWRSGNNPNVTSGLKSVILYKVIGTEKTVIYGDSTRGIFNASDTNSTFHMYYDADATNEIVDYYLIVVSDHAGNISKKKLTSQQSLLTWFHTSIDRSTYR